jgi:hypothetical protein
VDVSAEVDTTAVEADAERIFDDRGVNLGISTANPILVRTRH